MCLLVAGWWYSRAHRFSFHHEIFSWWQPLRPLGIFGLDLRAAFRFFCGPLPEFVRCRHSPTAGATIASAFCSRIKSSCSTFFIPPNNPRLPTAKPSYVYPVKSSPVFFSEIGTGTLVPSTSLKRPVSAFYSGPAACLFSLTAITNKRGLGCGGPRARIRDARPAMHGGVLQPRHQNSVWDFLTDTWWPLFFRRHVWVGMGTTIQLDTREC